MDGSTLKDRVAIVTGSSRGIGRAVALAFAREGGRVVVNYRSARGSALQVMEELERIHPGGGLLVQADVTREAEVQAMVEEAARRFGRIDILVNNAGIAHYCGFLDLSLAEWNRMIEGDLTSVFLCCRAVLPHLLQHGWGRIINVSSTSGMSGGTSGAHYAAAKAGVIALTKSLSSEFAARGITVNCIVPSKIETDMLWESSSGKNRQAMLEKIPVRRFGKPEEIAGLAVYLASDLAGYITGETIVASGGYR